MLSFFNQRRNKQPPRQYPNLDNCRFILKQNIDRTIQYYRGLNWAVASDHILVTLLNSIHSEALDKYSLYNSIINLVNMIASAKGVATNVAYGKVQHKSYFYGIDTQEIYIDQRFDDAYDQMMRKHYTEWETIRVVTHPFTSFDLQLANGKKRKSGETGLVVIKMDLCLLYAQYKLWLRDTLMSQYFDGTQKTIMNFVHSYPIPSMLKSHIDCAWFNRIMNTMQDLPISFEKPDSRLMLSNPYIGVETITKNIKRDITNSQADMFEWVCWVPGIYQENMHKFYLQDNLLETQQLRLPWLLGRYYLLRWLFVTDMVVQNYANQKYRHEYYRGWKEIKSNNLFKTIRNLDYEWYQRFEAIYEIVDETK